MYSKINAINECIYYELGTSERNCCENLWKVRIPTCLKEAETMFRAISNQRDKSARFSFPPCAISWDISCLERGLRSIQGWSSIESCREYRRDVCSICIYLFFSIFVAVKCANTMNGLNRTSELAATRNHSCVCKHQHPTPSTHSWRRR